MTTQTKNTPAGQTPPADPPAGAPKDPAFDPGQHSESEVTDYVAMLDAERARVLEAEKAGQARAGITALAAPVVSLPANPSATAPMPKSLSGKKVLAAINADDPDDADPDTVAGLQAALYRFGAQDPSLDLTLSWRRVQRRILHDPGKKDLDGVATAEQVQVFADRAGFELTR